MAPVQVDRVPARGFLSRVMAQDCLCFVVARSLGRRCHAAASGGYAQQLQTHRLEFSLNFSRRVVERELFPILLIVR